MIVTSIYIYLEIHGFDKALEVLRRMELQLKLELYKWCHPQSNVCSIFRYFSGSIDRVLSMSVSEKLEHQCDVAIDNPMLSLFRRFQSDYRV